MRSEAASASTTRPNIQSANAFDWSKAEAKWGYAEAMEVTVPTLDGGKGYEITGHHEIMVPLLAWAVVERLESPGR